MSQNTYKENVIKLAKQIKKEHFLKTFLWTAGIVLTLLWLSMLIATSVSGGAKPVYNGEERSFETKEAAALYAFDLIDYTERKTVIDGKTTYYIQSVGHWLDWNPLCLTYDPNLAGWFVCVVLAPIGYLGVIFIIAYLKNMITPQQVKKTVRRALQFGYLKQKDVDYVVDEIDYNIGIKERKTNEEKTNNQNLQLQ